MIITLGFTESDRSGDDISFSDGYRIGTPQRSITRALQGDGSHRSAQQWAEAAFAASNIAEPSTDPGVAAIQHALADRGRIGLPYAAGPSRPQQRRGLTQPRWCTPCRRSVGQPRPYRARFPLSTKEEQQHDH